MKRIMTILLAGAVAALQACQTPQVPLQTGDLLFVGTAGEARGAMDEAIASATGSITHVAIVEVGESGRVTVIDATPKRGVARYPLDSLLRDNPQAVFIVKRLRDTTGVAHFVENARRFIGEPYDMAFLPGNGAMYCSELIREAFRRQDGSYLFEEAPMNFLDPDGQMPAFWVQSFERQGIPVPQGVPGTNPQDMSSSPLLETVEADIP